MIDIGTVAGGVQHAKFFIVDGEEVFLGSQNFDWRALKHIHELGVRGARLGGGRSVRRGCSRWTGRRLAGGRQRSRQRDPSGSPRGRRRLELRACAAASRVAQAPGDTVELWPSYQPASSMADSTLWDLRRDRAAARLRAPRGRACSS